MLTQARLKELFDYDLHSGIFTVRSTGKVVVSGSGHKGMTPYQKILIDKKIYPAHRLAWLFVYGEFPDGVIDHIDGNGLNNKINNLRSVSQKINSRNSSIRSNNSSGVNGVSWHSHSKKWRAEISADDKRIELGRFEEFTDAVIARKNAEKVYGYHENHGRPKINFNESKKTRNKKLNKAVIRIDSAGIANIVHYGDLGSRHLFKLELWVNSNNSRVINLLSSGMVKVKLCGVCGYWFHAPTERKTICSDRCRTKKCREKKSKNEL